MLQPFVREAGSGPGVVCLHGNASSSSQWRGFHEIDVRDLLPHIHTPTLVAHVEGDDMVPFELGRSLGAGP